MVIKSKSDDIKMFINIKIELIFNYSDVSYFKYSVIYIRLRCDYVLSKCN